jgi:hypothetical protein
MVAGASEPLISSASDRAAAIHDGAPVRSLPRLAS